VATERASVRRRNYLKPLPIKHVLHHGELLLLGDVTYKAVFVKLTGFHFFVVAFSAYIPVVAPPAVQFS